MGEFRFAIGQEVRVRTHPSKPLGTIVARWTGEELRDVYGENIYQVSSFVTKQRESSLEPVLEGSACTYSSPGSFSVSSRL